MYLYLFFTIYEPFRFFVDFFTMFMIRRAEYQADAYAVKYNHATGMKSGLIRLFKENKGALVADPVYSALNHSHPTLIERLQAIDDLNDIKEKKFCEFFYAKSLNQNLLSKTTRNKY